MYDNIIYIPKHVANLMQGLRNISIIENYKKVKVKVKFTLEQATKAQR